MKATAPALIIIDPHFPPSFYAALWGLDQSTVTRWFRDAPGVLKVGKESRNGKRARMELRIPYSVAEREHEARSR